MSPDPYSFGRSLMGWLSEKRCPILRMINANRPELEIRTSFGAYLALSGIFFFIGIGFLCCWFFQLSGNSVKLSFSELAPAGSLIAVGMIWVIWLKGFRIRIENGELEYRDGFYRSRRFLISDIHGLKSAWVWWTVLGSKFRIPRLILKIRGSKNLLINVKLFQPTDIKHLIATLENRNEH